MRDLFFDEHIKDSSPVPSSLIQSSSKKVLTDIIVPENGRELFDSTFFKIKDVLTNVGYGNFNFISLDESFQRVKFSKNEKDLIEKLFEFDAKEYGFNDKKVITNLSNKIDRKDIKYIKGTGHFLFNDVVSVYDEMIIKSKDENPNTNPILTSGVRNIVKQLYLFMNKARKVDYNLSLASFSLAPPGYSFHGTSDFDIGKKYAGIANFDLRFLETDEYKVLNAKGYLSANKQRYFKGNTKGVRWEPWHVKVDLNRA